MLSIIASAQDIQTFVQKQMETYPKSRLLDIYKSCFQDYMGSEHLVSDRQRVKAYLDEELQSTSLDNLMAWLYEPCGVDGRYVRVSIRAIKEGLIKEDMLLDAFIRIANTSERPSQQRAAWATARSCSDKVKLTKRLVALTTVATSLLIWCKQSINDEPHSYSNRPEGTLCYAKNPHEGETSRGRNVSGAGGSQTKFCNFM